MSLAIYDENQVLLPATDGILDSPLRTFHDGYPGGSYAFKIYIRNSNASLFFTDVTLVYSSDVGIDTGPLGNSGWSIKFAYGENEPTEAEWDNIVDAEDLILPAIGGVGTPDLTYYPVWIRVYCPGTTPAQIRVNQRVYINYVQDNV